MHLQVQFILGFDCSSKSIHMAVLDIRSSAVVSLDAFESNSKDPEIRFKDVCDKFELFFSEFMTNKSNVMLVAAVESAIYVQNIKATNYINHVIAGVKRVLQKFNITYFPVDNHSWKKECLSNGRASKEDIMAFSKIKWGDIFNIQDEADAACIAFWGVQRFKNG